MSRESRSLGVARRDLAEARRSRLFWGAFGLIFLLVVPSFWSMVGSLHTVENAAPAAVRAVGRIPGYLSTYLFVLVAALAYAAVASERESGSVRLLLSLSATRWDVLVGKLLARGVLLTVVVGALLALLGSLVAFGRGTLPVVGFAVVAGWVVVYALCWTAFAAGLSAAFDSQYRALAAVAGTYVVLAWNAPVWKAVLEPGLRAVLPAALHGYVPALNPTLSLGVVGQWLLAATTPATSEAGVGPVIVSLGGIVFVAVVGPVVGYRLFRGADLG
ncbi:ABC transporter permease [Salinirubellus salinus]|jgi:ABC-2 type transport system permease protein|uniref:ABC transporter permease n=1 Tax=Salinirubellus salinus TaxID=1364945 RepID=A0A9E7UA47_9EURY|nr:ABC transporter permease [Salinirubellus salinus]UWM53479.1 ABC transporter permease [Salinirubellus salinus]